ncbi:MAG: metallophosphoesterase family protein [Desulfovibrionaceae bacterium]
MTVFSFIHAADIHLDTPFRNISQSLPEECKKMLCGAPVKALHNIADIAVNKGVDCVIFAGDIYNGVDKSIAGQLELINFAKILEKEDIPFFIAHGNHDPFVSDIQTLSYPDNTFVFPPIPHSRYLYNKSNEVVAVIHGISHEVQHEERNLAALFSPEETSLFQIAVLHCTLGNIDTRSKIQYAPCSLEGLLSSGMHYWALGHVHTRDVLHQYPHVVYPGNTQGLHSNERGLRGVYHVHVDNGTVTMEFHNTAPVIFKDITLILDEEETWNSLLEKIEPAMEDVLRAESVDNVEFFIVTLSLQGASSLNSLLREQSSELQGVFQKILPTSFPVWIQNVVVATQECIDFEEIMQRLDIVGETSRIAEELLVNVKEQEKLMETIKKELFFARGLARNSYSTDLMEISMKDVIQEAQRACVYLFDERK